MPISISAVIVTLNEEQNIGRCIDSLSGVADEVIVLDSLSTDKTAEICQTKGVKFFQKPWQGYSKSKNYANELATMDYLFSIDADEVLSDELRQSIIKQKKNPLFNAYSFNRLTNYCGHWIRYCGWYPDTKVRLFKRGEATWTGEIHEELVFSSPVEINKLQGDLLHYSFPTIASHVRTLNSFSEVAAKEAFSKKKRVSFLLHILLNPIFTFIKKYFLQKGFLDGYYGFVVCAISGFANFIKYVKLNELWKKER